MVLISRAAKDGPGQQAVGTAELLTMGVAMVAASQGRPAGLQTQTSPASRPRDTSYLSSLPLPHFGTPFHLIWTQQMS